MREDRCCYSDLRGFVTHLESLGELKRIQSLVNPRLEMTEICTRVLQKGGPALLFENPTGYEIPVLANLFGTTRRIALGMGCESLSDLREVGKMLATIKAPQPPQGWRDAVNKLPLLKQLKSMRPQLVRSAPCQEVVIEGDEVDLCVLPLQWCWPGDVAPLLTWGLTVTRGTRKKRQNLGIYRQQLLERNKLIMRWLPHRGGALDFRDHQAANPGQPFHVAVAIGCDPGTTLAAVTPVPDAISEYQFAGLLRSARVQLVKCLGSDLQVPASAEIVLEGVINPDDKALEGPFGDHTGYYNEAAEFPIFNVHRITRRRAPIYHSTYTGKPPDEPSTLGVALNEVFLPLLQQEYMEITDFYLPPEGCSYRLALVAIRKQYPGHARRIMFGLWGFLRQFMYTKFIIVVDDDINIRDWQEVVWAIATRVDASRDTLIADNTPIDYLDFASPDAGLGSKLGLDATNKWSGETKRQWGKVIRMDAAVVARVDELWKQLGL